MTTKEKKPQDPREPNLENVAISKILTEIMRKNKKKEGTPIRFFVQEAIVAKMKAEGIEVPENIN